MDRRNADGDEGGSPLMEAPVRKGTPGLDEISFGDQGIREFHLTFRPIPGEALPAMFARMSRFLKERDATVLMHSVYADQVLRGGAGRVDWPLTWLEGTGKSGNRIDGMHVLAVSGAKVETVHLNGRPVGRIFQDGRARHCLIGDVGPTDPSKPKEIQAGEAFENLRAALGQAGMVLTDIVRTWLSLDDILSWYGPLNKVRTDFYTKHKIFDGLLPASTGVGERNRDGAALVLRAWASQSLDGSKVAHEVPSPLQCPAPQYGSSFSRAVTLDRNGHRRVMVSGTASINSDGTSAHDGDVGLQITQTMDVVKALLVACSADFDDVTRAVAYFKDPREVDALRRWREDNGVRPFPTVVTEAHICRDELLFEIEVDAVAGVP